MESPVIWTLVCHGAIAVSHARFGIISEGEGRGVTPTLETCVVQHRECVLYDYHCIQRITQAPLGLLSTDFMTWIYKVILMPNVDFMRNYG